MSSYKHTQIRKPSNEAEFERNCQVLFACLLKDRTVKPVGRRGLGQQGVDLLGLRNGNAKLVVGVQCKLKGEGKRLTKREIGVEVNKALTFSPRLTEYYIVTTAPDETSLQQYALTLAQQQAKLRRSIKIEIWGWGILVDEI